MRALLPPVAALVAIALVAGASHEDFCGSRGQPALGTVQVGADAAATFYVDDRNFVLGNGVWIYQESNGWFDASWTPAENLQRGNPCASAQPRTCTVPEPDGDRCWDDLSSQYGPDYQIF